MQGVKINVSDRDLAEVRALLAGVSNGAATAIYRAINKGLSTAKTQAAKGVGARLGLKAARIKKDFSLKKARRADLSGALVSTGAPVGLINFSPRVVKKGVSVIVRRSGGRKLLKHAFRATSKKARKDGTTYSTEHLWWRSYSGPRSGTGTKHARYFAGLPAGNKYKGPDLERLSGPRIEDILAAPEVINVVQAKAADQYTASLVTETEAILRKYV